MDVLDALNRLSFDIIGITAFEHDFAALPDMRHESFPYDWDARRALPAAEEGAGKDAEHVPGEGGRVYEEYDEMFGPHDGRSGIRGMLHVLFPIMDTWFVRTPVVPSSSLLPTNVFLGYSPRKTRNAFAGGWTTSMTSPPA
jgi:hypothetical protein